MMKTTFQTLHLLSKDSLMVQLPHINLSSTICYYAAKLFNSLALEDRQFLLSFRNKRKTQQYMKNKFQQLFCYDVFPFYPPPGSSLFHCYLFYIISLYTTHVICVFSYFNLHVIVYLYLHVLYFITMSFHQKVYLDALQTM